MLQNGYVYVYYCAWIKPPHPKIALCICNQLRWVFWFNSDARFHGIGQLACVQTDHPRALTKSCYLDLSGLKQMSETEVSRADDRGPLNDVLRGRVLAALAAPIKTLSDPNRQLAIQNLT